MKFRELRVGQTFDFVNPAPEALTWNSFYLRCTKIGERKYEDSKGMMHKVGSINATVYHVEEGVSNVHN